jgi:hypothetical protein
MMRAKNLLWFLVLALVCLALPALAQEAPATVPGPTAEAKARAWGGIFLFWSGAVVIMFLIGRVLFKEQLNQLKTQRILIRQIGPFFPEFDTDFLTAWVGRLVPHIFRGWKTRDVSGVADYLTPAFASELERRYADEAARGLVHEVAFEKVLRVHYLGLYPVAEGPPPKGLELVLRLEIKGVHAVRDPAGQMVAGQAGPRQIQQFWTLRHDGRVWRLHQVEPATDERTDLAKKPPLPPLMEWKRPPDSPGA